MSTLNGKTPQQIAKEVMSDLPTDRIKKLAEELGVTYEKAASVVRQEQRAREYRKKQQELAKQARKTPAWKAIFAK